MTTYSALTICPNKDQAEALGSAMENLVPEPTGIGVTSIEDGSGQWEVGGYFIDAPDETGLTVLAVAFQAKPFVISEVPDVDWVAHVKRELAPVVAGRFFVYGSHDADKVPADVVPLAIDAAMAFGTGHHGTTQGCLMALDRLESEGFTAHNIADIGCGTAVLAMGAAKIWPDQIILTSDIDEVAVETARANAVFNGLEGRLDCITCAGFEHERLQAKAPFDLIFANILKSPLILLAPDMGRFIINGGYVILSGILNEQADDVIAAYDAQGFTLSQRDEIGEWTTLTMKKARA